METLNVNQLKAVNSDDANIVCIASPGSGKTRTLTERIARLVRDGHDPRRFAVLTFTNAAADELTKRIVDTKLGYCGTLHGFMLRAIQAHGSRVGLGPNPTVLDEQQAADMLRRCVIEQRYRGTKRDIDEALRAGPSVKAPTLAGLVAMAYFQTLASGNLLTFDTILHYGQRVAHLCTGYTHLFVDEAQDSSLHDWDIYDALPMPNKFFVGDVDQAIYSFRGGDPSGLIAWSLGRDVVTIRLEDNYRCAGAIAETAQQLIERNANRVRKSTVSKTWELGKVFTIAYPTAFEEMQKTCAWVCGVMSPQNSVAVLLRTNHLARQFSEALEAAGVRVAKRLAPTTPLDWRTCKAALAFLNDPENDMLASLFQAHINGQAVADKLRINAAAQGKSINAMTFNLGPVYSLHTVGQTLRRLGISVESVALVDKALAGMPVDDALHDLTIRLIEQENHTDEVGDGVTVCTMHAAKGREFDCVFLPAFEQSVIPGDRKNGDVEEERRLAYVAMTRARHELVISWTAERKPEWGPAVPAKPSQFVEEAGL